MASRKKSDSPQKVGVSLCANEIDVKENHLLKLDPSLLKVLISDNTSGKNIIWAVNDYKEFGKGYSAQDQITIPKITGKHGEIIKPRTEKSADEQKRRVQEKAEVFTPTKICNDMNNLVDKHLDKKDWQNYVRKTWLEITCGEAPYIVSRYDTTTGEFIKIAKRIGFLDRKLQAINKSVKRTEGEDEWLKWVKIAYQNSYGYEWQGDNLLLARENLLYTFIDYYEVRFKVTPSIELLLEFAEIIAWNIFQADGLKFVIPLSCKSKKVIIKAASQDLFGDVEEVSEIQPCPGCTKNNPKEHTGKYVKIKDWDTGKIIKFIDVENENKETKS
jgi:hypothetical protein